MGEVATQWFDGDDPVVEARLVEVDGEWAISTDPGLPTAGRITEGVDGDFAAVPGVGGDGLTLRVRFTAPSILVERS